jgi:hypothetical protein
MLQKMLEIVFIWQRIKTKLGKIFINDSDRGRLYKMKTDGTQLTKIADDTDCYSMNLQGDAIFYLREDIDAAGSNRPSKLYRIQTDGTKQIEIPVPVAEPIYKMIVEEKYIYYFLNHGSYDIYRMNTDGTGNLQLLKGLDFYKTFSTTVDNALYYSDNHSLNRINTAGETKNIIPSSAISISGSWAYEPYLITDNRIYYLAEGKNQLYRFNLDGTNRRIIAFDPTVK